jgi:hypothetical protein
MANGSDLRGSCFATGLIAMCYRADHIFDGAMKIVISRDRGQYDFLQQIDKKKRPGQDRWIANPLLGFVVHAVAVVLAVVVHSWLPALSLWPNATAKWAKRNGIGTRLRQHFILRTPQSITSTQGDLRHGHQGRKNDALIRAAAASFAAVGGGLAQAPGADTAVITPIQVAMIVAIGAEHGTPMSKTAAAELILPFSAAAAGAR